MKKVILFILFCTAESTFRVIQIDNNLYDELYIGIQGYPGHVNPENGGFRMYPKELVSTIIFISYILIKY